MRGNSITGQFISHVFYLLCLMLRHWALLILEDCPGSSEHAFQMQTNQSEAQTPLHPLLVFHTSSHYSSVLITLGSSARQLETDSIHESLLKVLKLTNPKPAHSAFPIPFHGNHKKGTCPQFSLSPLASSPTPGLPIVHVPHPHPIVGHAPTPSWNAGV